MFDWQVVKESKQDCVNDELKRRMIGFGFKRLLANMLAGAFGGTLWIFSQRPFATLARRARAQCLRWQLSQCGRNLTVHGPVVITSPKKVSIGDDVSLAPWVHIWGGGGLTIGSRVMVGTHVSISSLTHDYTQEVMISTLIKKPVTICDDVWTGSNAIVLPGVTVGEGAVVGAGAVVTHDVPSFAIVAGVPARVIGWRPSAISSKHLGMSPQIS